MHKIVTVKCPCGFSVQMSEIQFDDFDCGMMGFMNCSKCDTVLLPSHRRTNSEIKEEVIEVEGKDRGWC